MPKKKKETITLTFRNTRPLKIAGSKRAISELVKIVTRGAAEMYIDDQTKLGRTREAIVQAMVDRIRISEQHYKLGETDGLNCDLRDA